jgi:cation diffusion facilitator family transporter
MSSSTFFNNRQHNHIFDEGNPLAERNTRWAVALTVVMMIAEISGGWLFNSMALLADGWHMSSHAFALGLSVLAYAAARKYAHDHRFSFGTWKIEVLGGYTSALFLVAVALMMLYHSAERLIFPNEIHYNQAISVAIIGLIVNLICAWLLKGGSHHHHHHHHGHEEHAHHHEDLNLRSAYIHVITDAATSVLAIFALFGGKYWQANWLDPLMGIVGAMVVGIWAYGLLRDTTKVLLDAEMDAPVVEEIRDVIKTSLIPADISDLHVWRVGKGKYAAIIAIETNSDVTPDELKKRLQIHEELVHLSIEVNQVHE